MSTVGTSPETAIASLPPDPDILKSREKDREKWRKVTPPERKKATPHTSQILEEPETQRLHPAPEEPLPSSEDTSHPPLASERVTSEEDGLATVMNGVPHRTPSRRGIWDWARAGTGRLNIIGRLPHPEWKGPITARTPEAATNGVMSSGTVTETQDDFRIPSTTSTQLDNELRQSEAAAAKIEGLGLVDATVISPSFAQTMARSSDDLVAAASSTGTPASRYDQDEPWTNDEPSTPSAASKDSPPSTPDTPTPQQRRKDLSTDTENSATRKPPKKLSTHTGEPSSNGDVSSVTETPTKVSASEDTDAKGGKPATQDIPSQSKDTVHTAHGDSNSTNTLKEEQSTSEDTATNDTPKSTKSKQKRSKKGTPQSVPTYKIALAPNLFSPARNGTVST